MAGASKFGGTENGADCSKCGGTVAVLFKTRNGTSLDSTDQTCPVNGFSDSLAFTLTLINKKPFPLTFAQNSRSRKK